MVCPKPHGVMIQSIYITGVGSIPTGATKVHSAPALLGIRIAKPGTICITGRRGIVDVVHSLLLVRVAACTQTGRTPENRMPGLATRKQAMEVVIRPLCSHMASWSSG